METKETEDTSGARESGAGRTDVRESGASESKIDSSEIKIQSSKSIISKRLLLNFKTNIQDLVTDLVELYPKYNFQLSIVSLYVSGIENEDIVDYILLYIENIFVKKISIRKENLLLFIDTVIKLVKKSVFKNEDTSGARESEVRLSEVRESGAGEMKEFEDEIESIKKDLNEKIEIQDSLLDYWRVFNDTTEKYIKHTPILKLKYSE